MAKLVTKSHVNVDWPGNQYLMTVSYLETFYRHLKKALAALEITKGTVDVDYEVYACMEKMYNMGEVLAMIQVKPMEGPIHHHNARALLDELRDRFLQAIGLWIKTLETDLQALQGRKKEEGDDAMGKSLKSTLERLKPLLEVFPSKGEDDNSPEANEVEPISANGEYELETPELVNTLKEVNHRIHTLIEEFHDMEEEQLERATQELVALRAERLIPLMTDLGAEVEPHPNESQMVPFTAGSFETQLIITNRLLYAVHNLAVHEARHVLYELNQQHVGADQLQAKEDRRKDLEQHLAQLQAIELYDLNDPAGRTAPITLPFKMLMDPTIYTLIRDLYPVLDGARQLKKLHMRSLDSSRSIDDTQALQTLGDIANIVENTNVIVLLNLPPVGTGPFPLLLQQVAGRISVYARAAEHHIDAEYNRLAEYTGLTKLNHQARQTNLSQLSKAKYLITEILRNAQLLEERTMKFQPDIDDSPILVDTPSHQPEGPEELFAGLGTPYPGHHPFDGWGAGYTQQPNPTPTNPTPFSQAQPQPYPNHPWPSTHGWMRPDHQSAGNWAMNGDNYAVTQAIATLFNLEERRRALTAYRHTTMLLTEIYHYLTTCSSNAPTDGVWNVLRTLDLQTIGADYQALEGHVNRGHAVNFTKHTVRRLLQSAMETSQRRFNSIEGSRIEIERLIAGRFGQKPDGLSLRINATGQFRQLAYDYRAVYLLILDLILT